MGRVVNIAHRGASGYAPENTIESFLKATELGADMVEMDIHQTPDFKLIVTHDYPPDNKALPSIPELQDIIEALRNKDIKLNIEVKRGFKLYPNIEENLIGLLEKECIIEKTLISSFEGYCISRIRELNKDVSLGIIFTDKNYKKVLEDAVRVNACVLATDKRFVSAQNLKQIHKAGFKLYAYTVNNPSQMQRLISMGIDGIYTNYPDRLRKILKTKNLNTNSPNLTNYTNEHHKT